MRIRDDTCPKIAPPGSNVSPRSPPPLKIFRDLSDLLFLPLHRRKDSTGNVDDKLQSRSRGIIFVVTLIIICFIFHNFYQTTI